MGAIRTLCVLLAFSATAFGEDLTPEQWEGLQEQYAKPARRHENISKCTATFTAKLSAEDIKPLEEEYKTKGRDAVADFCADYIEGVASGEITYEDVYGEPK